MKFVLPFRLRFYAYSSSSFIPSVTKNVFHHSLKNESSEGIYDVGFVMIYDFCVTCKKACFGIAKELLVIDTDDGENQSPLDCIYDM